MHKENIYITLNFTITSSTVYSGLSLTVIPHLADPQLLSACFVSLIKDFLHNSFTCNPIPCINNPKTAKVLLYMRFVIQKRRCLSRSLKECKSVTTE